MAMTPEQTALMQHTIDTMMAHDKAFPRDELKTHTGQSRYAAYVHHALWDNPHMRLREIITNEFKNDSVTSVWQNLSNGDIITVTQFSLWDRFNLSTPYGNYSSMAHNPGFIVDTKLHF